MIQNRFKSFQYLLVYNLIIFIVNPKIDALKLSGPGLGSHIIMPARYFFLEVDENEKRYQVYTDF